MGLLNDVMKLVRNDNQTILELKFNPDYETSEPGTKKVSEELLKELIKKN